MPRFMLDTDRCSCIMKRSQPLVLKRVQAVPVDDVCMSVVTKAELLLYGVEVSPRRAQDADALGVFLRYVEVLAFADAAARRYAEIRADLRRRGAMIGANDLFIAAHARALASSIPRARDSMRTVPRALAARLVGVMLTPQALAQQAAGQKPKPSPKETEVWEPEPTVITPGATDNDAPSDAIVLFDGTNLDEWETVKDKSPAGWNVHDGVMTVHKPAGNIQTKRSFTNYQLHLEWRIPTDITGKDQARGNSGLFLASVGGGDGEYELQILDSYQNRTYSNGQAGSIYKQAMPLVNAMRKPGEWQTYDVVWAAPTFNADGTVKTPARVTAFHNGVLIQNNSELQGETLYIGKPFYRAHGATPIKLQSHGDPSEPISLRNIWLRELQ